MSSEPKLSKEFAQHLGGGQKIDTTETFDLLLATRDKAWDMISGTLNFEEDMHCADIHEFDDLNGDPLGRIRNFTGPECHVDWVIHSNIGHPRNTFTNIHLTFWMKGTTDIPHLGLAFGTLPDAFFYADMMPRYELVTNPDHCQTYYDPVNNLHLQLGKDLYADGYTVLIPQMSYIRSSLSPCVLAGITSPEFYKEKAEPRIFKLVEYWIDLVKNAREITDAKKQVFLTDRDYQQRKSIVYMDPANPIAERLVGKSVANRLVRILAGEERGA